LRFLILLFTWRPKKIKKSKKIHENHCNEYLSINTPPPFLLVRIGKEQRERLNCWTVTSVQVEPLI
jgi:hypothetical protein